MGLASFGHSQEHVGCVRANVVRQYCFKVYALTSMF